MGHTSVTPPVHTNLLFKAQIVCLSVCVFAFGGHVFCPFATEIDTHTRHTRPHQSCVDRMHRRPSQSFERSNILPTKLTLLSLSFSPNSDCICTESNLHVFCSKRYTGSVSISIETGAKSKIRIHLVYPGPRNKDCT